MTMQNSRAAGRTVRLQTIILSADALNFSNLCKSDRGRTAFSIFSLGAVKIVTTLNGLRRN